MHDGASSSNGEKKANLHEDDDQKMVCGVKVFLLAVLGSRWRFLRTLTSAGFSLRTKERKRGSH